MSPSNMDINLLELLVQDQNKGDYTMKNTTSIINEAVKKANNTTTTRHECAMLAARLADKKGINVNRSPYRQDLFYEALDQYFTKTELY